MATAIEQTPASPPTSTDDAKQSPKSKNSPKYHKQPSLRQYIQLNPGYYDSNGQFIPGGVVKCPFSGDLFNINDKEGLDAFLKHLIENYKLVIADVKLIADFQQYIHYWTERFNAVRCTLPSQSVALTLSQFCAQIQTNPKDPNAERETYFFLSDQELEEDKQLRQSLQLSRLEYVLSQQEAERAAFDCTFKCFFCRYRWDKVNRSEVVLHLAQCHKFNIGHPDNLVFAKEFLLKLKDLFDALQCTFCKKTFKDKSTLLEHMKKKYHKKLDPDDFSFDKYYIINYLEPGKHWKEHQIEIKAQELLAHQLKREAKRIRQKAVEDAEKPADEIARSASMLNIGATEFVPKSKSTMNLEEEQDSADTDDEETWLEQPDYSGHCFKCLFSDNVFQTSEETLLHMKTVYNFDMDEVSRRGGFNFYDRIKIINYIRAVVRKGEMNQEDIFENIGKRSWDHIQYLFSTFENDQLLYSFEAMHDGIDDSVTAHTENAPVIQEDGVDQALIRSTSVLKDLVLDD